MIRALLMLSFAVLALPALGQQTPKRLLLVTHTAGYRHSSIPNAIAAIESLAKQDGRFLIEHCRTAEDVKRMMTREALALYDGVIFANTTGNIGIPDMERFLGWLRSGKAFIGMHSAGDSYRLSRPDGDVRFRDMLGASFKEHGEQCEVELVLDRPNHVATSSLKQGQKVFDEIYHFAEPTSWIRRHARVIVSLNKHPMDGLAGEGSPKNMPLAWTKGYGEGRVFYTALGHREDIWESEWYQKHILGGILWALKINP